MKKMFERSVVKKVRKKARIREQEFEAARATRAGTFLHVYDPTTIYSLSTDGNVRQSMTFRRSDTGYVHGCGWSFVRTGETVETFRERYESIGFKIVTREPKPRKINYEKSLRVDSLKKPPKPMTRLALEERQQVVELRLEGLTLMKIEEQMGVLGKKGFWAMKILRQAEANA